MPGDTRLPSFTAVASGAQARRALGDLDDVRHEERDGHGADAARHGGDGGGHLLRLGKGDVADQAAVNRLVALGDDYVTRNLAELRAVTPEAATEAYTSLVDVDALTLVVVGDADVVADPLRELGFDDLEVVRPEG